MDSRVRDIRVSVQRVEQARSYWCGAACAKMVLDRIGVACDQGDAFNGIFSETRFATERLYSDPQGISDFLNNATPEAIEFEVREYATAEFDTLLSYTLHTLAFLELPCITLTNNGDHWVVVDGLRVLEGADGNIEVLGAYIQNPWFKELPAVYCAVEEFRARRVTPNRWGVRWRDRLVIISDGGPKIVRSAGAAPPQVALLADGGAQLSLLARHGFQGLREPAGGAGESAETEILGGQGTPLYKITMLDALATPEFQDLIYVAVTIDGQTLLEVATAGQALGLPSDDFAKERLDSRFPSAKILNIWPGYYFFEGRYDVVSRFDVTRVCEVDGVHWLVHRNGEILPYEAPQRSAGG